MKKIIHFSLLIILLSTYTHSLKAQRRNVFGEFMGGGTATTMDIEGGNEFKKLKIGFMMGGFVNYRFYQQVHVQSGFLLMKKGLEKHEDRDKSDPSISSKGKIDVKTKLDANYIQVPLNLGVDIKLKKEWIVSVNAGVYAAYGFKGKSKQRGYEIIDSKTIDKNWGEEDTFKNDRFKRWDYGIGGNIALIYDIYLIKFQYDHGLCNIAGSKTRNPNNSVKQGNYKNRSYMVAVGFRF